MAREEAPASIGGGGCHDCSALTSVIIKNPDCKFVDDAVQTIPRTATIYGYENSTAQEYAQRFNHKFEILNEEEQKLSYGDINGDTAINIMDVILINKAIYGKADLTAEQVTAADVNKDGKPDATDSLLIMKYIIHLINSFD